ncbi:hypothetical protein MBUL_03187 [Methylobacterium bullatum]|uniref:Pesticin C-terminal domain-containing protein n=1 Tax=Methylobacterium bullatum TaxID=570505 RepID=A0A679JCA9_9HYPH|nr:hypothetical protein MBUL_03187 [Methylobacterium bullatum]
MTDETQLTITEEELEQARSEREGMETLEPYLEGPADDGTETAQPTGPASGRMISAAAFDLIVEFEVSNKALYSKKYRAPIWPEGASGVTIGIGYDVGYTTEQLLKADFGGVIPGSMIAALKPAIGVKGAAARQVAANLAGSIDVPWEAAIEVHRDKVIPRWTGLVERSLPNTDALSADGLGALVSLTYNRGASFNSQGDRYTEMRAIKEHMKKKFLSKISAEFRSMKRIWPNVVGLQKRREREARLFEQGLRTS